MPGTVIPEDVDPIALYGASVLLDAVRDTAGVLINTAEVTDEARKRVITDYHTVVADVVAAVTGDAAERLRPWARTVSVDAPLDEVFATAAVLSRCVDVVLSNPRLTADASPKNPSGNGAYM